MKMNIDKRAAQIVTSILAKRVETLEAELGSQKAQYERLLAKTGQSHNWEADFCYDYRDMYCKCELCAKEDEFVCTCKEYPEDTYVTCRLCYEPGNEPEPETMQLDPI
jgi:hypothetical protein